MDAWESSFIPATGERSTTNGADINVGTNDCGLSDNLVGSGKSNPSTC